MLSVYQFLLLLALSTAAQGSILSPGSWTWFGSDPAALESSPSSTEMALSQTRALLPRQDSTDWVPSLSHLVQSIGTKLPLRGLASLAGEIGLPGANQMLALLTPPRDPQPTPWQRFKANFWGSSPTKDTATSITQSSQPPSAPFSEEIISLVGSILGEQECLRKLACLSARHLTDWNGAPTVTLLLSTVTNRLPQQWLAPYKALRDAMMYSESCGKYKCDHQQSS